MNERGKKMNIIRVLKKSIREYKRDSILTPILVAFEALVECIIPLMVANLVNKMQNGCDLSVILKYGVILIIMACFSLLFGALAGITVANASAGFGKNLRKDLFMAVQNFSFENIDRFSASSLVTRMTTDVTNVQMAYMMIIRTVVRSPLMLIFSLVMGFIMGGPLAFIFLFTIPVLGIGLGLVIKKTMPLFRKVFKKYDNLNNSVQENINGIRVVKSFVREDFEMKKFNEAAEDVCADFTKAEKILALNNPMMQFCLYVVMIFVLTFGSYLVVNFGGAIIQVGQLSSLLTYSFQILMSLMMLSMIFVMVTISIESCERIVAVLEEKRTISNPENPIYEVNDGSIDFDNVSFKYSKRADRNALENINLHIKSGQTIGILGGTGSSKTSLVNLISRLYDVTEGEVKVAGVDVRDYDLVTLRDAVSVVLQKNVLFSGSIKDNLRWGNKDATDEEIEEACHLACADEFIEQFPDKYDTHIEQGGTNVSGGQKQRTAIARALVTRPAIILADEPTGNLDSQTELEVMSLLKSCVSDFGQTLIMITHDETIAQMADEMIIIEDGKAVRR